MAKLIDILARELAEWPKESAKAMQDFDKEIRFFDSVGDQMASFDFYAEELACDACDEKTFAGGGTEVTRAEWQAAVDALNAPKVVEWDGVGLPPVGLDVEVMQGGLPSVAFDWEACKILAINIGSDEKPQVITRDFRGDAAIYYPGIDSVYFRPIRTAEQVAAEEREKAIKQMVFGVCGCEQDGGNTATFMVCGFLYDAGYRKQ